MAWPKCCRPNHPGKRSAWILSGLIHQQYRQLDRPGPGSGEDLSLRSAFMNLCHHNALTKQQGHGSGHRALLLLLGLYSLPWLPNTQAAALHIQQATLSFSISSVFPAWRHFVKSLLLSKLLTNRSNMSIWIIWWHKHGQIPQPLLSSPSAGLSRCLPLLGCHGMPKLTVKTSLIQLSRWVTFPCLDGRVLLNPGESTNLYMCLHTSVCLYTHTWMDIHTDI